MGNIVQFNSGNRKNKYASIVELIEEITEFADSTALTAYDKNKLGEYLEQFAYVIKEDIIKEFAESLAKSLEKEGLNVSVKTTPQE